MKLNFGNNPRWLVLGGGVMLVAAIEHLTAKGCRPLVVCGRRHLDELLQDGATLDQRLRSLGIEMIESVDANTDEAILSRIDGETVGLSFDAPWIFRREFIARFGGRLVNSHGARLPQDRGGGGFSWRIMRGERLGYSILHQVLPKVDAGAIVDLREYVFPTSCRIPQDYFDFAVAKDIEFVRGFVDAVMAGSDFNLISQPEYLSVYFPRLATDIHGFIDWTWDVAEIERFICAFDDPYGGASTYWQQRRLRVKKAFALSNDGTFHPFQYGLIYRRNDQGIFVACKSGGLLVQQAFMDGEESLPTKARVGDRLYTPREYLEEAQQYRAVYTAHGLVPKS